MPGLSWCCGRRAAADLYCCGIFFIASRHSAFVPDIEFRQHLRVKHLPAVICASSDVSSLTLLLTLPLPAGTGRYSVNEMLGAW